MRKLIIISAALILLVGCGKKDNPFAPNTDVNTGKLDNLGKVLRFEPGYNQPLTANEIRIYFDDYMDSSTINITNLTVYDAVARGNVTVTVTYNKDARLAILAGTFIDNTKFLITVKADVKTLGGQLLDGNGNGRSEGTPYDDQLSLCWRGTGNAIFVRTSPPLFDSTTSTPFRTGSVPTDTNVLTIQLRFANGPMDSASITDVNNYELKTGGSPVGLRWVAWSGTGVDLKATTNLTANTLYDFMIKGAKVKARKDTTGLDNYLLILDGDYDGPEATEPDRKWQFFTAGTNTPPRLSGVTRIASPPGASFNFNARMKDNTLTSDKVKVYDAAGYVPGSFVFSPDTSVVQYYYQRTVGATLQYFVSKEVQANTALKFDGNNNGIGGEPWDDKWGSF